MLLPPGLQRHDVLQQKPTLGGNQRISSNSKKIFKCMLSRTFIFKMLFLFKLNNPKMKLQMEEDYFYMVYHAIMKACMAQNFFLIF